MDINIDLLYNAIFTSMMIMETDWNEGGTFKRDAAIKINNWVLLDRMASKYIITEQED